MVAMDVVDTIRHGHLIVERELDSAGRRKRLIDRLREIYRAQGIDVSDAALEAGVDALEEERFSYTPPPPGLSRSLARLYVRRSQWLRGLSIFAGLALASVAFSFTAAATLFAQGGPDFTKGEAIPEKADHDWNLGATGARGCRWPSRQGGLQMGSSSATLSRPRRSARREPRSSIASPSTRLLPITASRGTGTGVSIVSC